MRTALNSCPPQQQGPGVGDSERGAGRWGAVFGFIICLWVCGCRSVSPVEPVDLLQPGWQVTERPAVWRPSRSAPELVGELLIATHLDGRRFVQFSKQSLPLVIARTEGSLWRISSPMKGRGSAGRLPVPEHVLWLQIDGLPPKVSAKSRWEVVFDANDRWLLNDRRTGESLEVAAP